jgi:hypothetical protein
MGKLAKWRASEIAWLYEIKVIVSDSFGEADERIITISVSQYPPLQIVEVHVTHADPKYCKEENGRHIVLTDQKYTIECVVDNAHEGLTYEWFDGEDTYTGPSCCGTTAFSGQGSKVIWTASDMASDVIISVYVYNELGNAASKSLHFRVESCGCDF